MFFVRWQDVNGGPYTTISLNPAPTNVDYPAKRLYKSMNTQDGSIVVQRPLRDDRPRRWIWKGGRSTLPTYENQWTALKALEYRTRLLAGKPATVEIWEDETGVGGFDGLTGGTTKVWTKVKFLQVDRVVRQGGGKVVYEDSVIEFVVADDNYSGF